MFGSMENILNPLDVGSSWDFLDYPIISNDNQSIDFILSDQSVMEIDFSVSGGSGNYGDEDGIGSSEAKEEKECSRKRVRTESCGKQGNKACREKLRREKLNDKFMELCSVLEPERPTKTDKPAILDDAIRVLGQLKNEAQELKETNEKLLEEIKTLKAEKCELREEKLVLKADKEKMEQQLKTMTMSPSGYMPAAHPAAYQNKMVYPSYSLVPMWHYLPQSTRDTSRDHELRPPAA